MAVKLRGFEVRIRGFASTDEALALQEPIARVLCPVEEHVGPCEVPWGFTLVDDERAEDEPGDLLLGIYSSQAKADEIVERVRDVAGDEHPVELREGRPGRFEELVEQYEIENRHRR